MAELDYHDQTEIIPFDIEYVMLVADTIHRIECGSNIGKTCPMASAGFRVPFFQSILGFGVRRIIIY